MSSNMNQASSNSSMPRTTAETLKQIQKQGLSISIVSKDNSRSSHPLESPVSKEMKPKQIVANDKTPKLPTRSSVPTENKATLMQSRSLPNSAAETRVSGGQMSNQSVFQDNKTLGSVNKSMVPISSPSETRAFGSQSWSNPPSSESKIQAGPNRAVQSVGTHSESKNQNISGRLSQSQLVFSEGKSSESKNQNISGRLSQSQVVFSECKSQNAKGNQNVGDGKKQSRICQVNCHPDSKHLSNRSQLSFEGKVPSNMSRNPINSPPLETKVLNTSQMRQGQNFSTENSIVSVPISQFLGDGKMVNKSINSSPLETKVLNTSQMRQGQNFSTENSTVSVPISQFLGDGKMVNNQSKSVSSKVVDIKLPTQLRVSQIMKGTPAERILQPKVLVVEPSKMPQSNMVLHNPFRVASTAGDKSSATMQQEKAVFKVNRVAQSTVHLKNQSSMQTKNLHSTSMQSDSKAVSQIIKISSGPSDNSQKASVSLDNLPDIPSGINTMSSTRGTAKRPQIARATACTPALKKKCVKRLSPNFSEQDSDQNNLNAGTPKGIEMQGLTRGLSITPVNTTTTSTSSSTSRNTTESTHPNNNAVICSNCRQYSCNLNFCDSCNTQIPPDSKRYHIKKMNVPSVVVRKNVTTTSTIKEIVYQFPDAMTQNQSFHFQQAVTSKMFETSTPLSTKGRGRSAKTRRKVEPVCYTLSSDEEDPVTFSSMDGTSLHASQIYPIESEGSKSGHSSASEVLHDENLESDDPQFPGVMDINPNLNVEEEPDEEMEYEGEEMEEEEEMFSEEECDEEVGNEEEEEEDENVEEVNRGQDPTDYPLQCRSIRIGSYKVHPHVLSPYIGVILSKDGFSFEVPTVTHPHVRKHVTLRNEDIVKMYVHFGKCLPIMFIKTSPKWGESLRKVLLMTPNEQPYFDPQANDDKIQRLTFLIEAITEDQRQFIRNKFYGNNKIMEVDQKTANEILVRSTPNNQPNRQLVNQNRISSIITTTDNSIPHVSSQITLTKLPSEPQPVVKLLTYPAPPLTGGIAITSEDLNCLNEGEFLNDAIIDFYLKYVFHEKLSRDFQDRTHIFSSFFYPRLTHRPERPRAGDDASKAMSVRRHNQVKTWTRHVDIFSKDYIIIPVNQNVHWFLAIICYPNRVPDAPNIPETSVTSTDEQENASKVTIKEINSNGEDDSPNQDENSMNSSMNSPYEVEEPPDSDEGSAETPDSSTHPDGKQRKEMPCICIFDSLSGPSRWRIATILREYLDMEWKSKKGTKKLFDRSTMQGFIMKCPQQTNFSDCGMYLLQFVESFFENPIQFCSPMPDLTNWFTENKINKKRQQLKDLISNLHKKETIAASRKSMDRSQSSSANMQQSENR